MDYNSTLYLGRYLIFSENKYYNHILTSKIIHLTFPKGAQSNSNIELSCRWIVQLIRDLISGTSKM